MTRRVLAALALLASALVVLGPGSPAVATDSAPYCNETPSPRPVRAAALTTPDRVSVAADATTPGQAVLDLAARPTPVDVFFVFDSSGSMDPVFASLKESISEAAVELEQSGIDVFAGLADFSDLRSRPYRRLVPLGPVDCGIQQALDRVRTYGGEEPHRLALEQAIVGSGQPRVRVPAGLGAQWRPGTLRLILHATDEDIDNLDYSPDHDELVELFLANGVRHVGIHALGLGVEGAAALATEAPQVRMDLDELARDTNTIAPPEGLDCDGDGVPELLAGAPITCTFGQANRPAVTLVRASLGKVVTQVVRALRSTTAIELALIDNGGGVQVDIAQPVRDVDLADPTKQSYDLGFRCPSTMGGREVPVKLGAKVGGEVVASATTVVSCAAAPIVAAAPPIRAAAVVPTPVAEPSIASTSAAQGAGQASAPVGSISQAPAQSPMVGMAGAPQQEMQVARARARDSDGNVGTTAAAGAMALGAAAALRRRRSVAPQRRR